MKNINFKKRKFFRGADACIGSLFFFIGIGGCKVGAKMGAALKPLKNKGFQSDAFAPKR